MDVLPVSVGVAALPLAGSFSCVPLFATGQSEMRLPKKEFGELTGGKREAGIRYVTLFATVILGVAFGIAVGHPGDPPHVFTIVACSALILNVIGALQCAIGEQSKGWKTRLVVSVVLACYCGFVIVAEPFLHFDGRHVAGLLVPIGVLVPVMLAGLWFFRQRCRPQAIGAALFIWISVSLITFNMQWTDPAAFVTKIR